MGSIITTKPCKDRANDVSLVHGDMNLENQNSTLTTVANLRHVTTKNGCTATLIFSEKENPEIRLKVAELLLRSLQKRSEAT